MGFQVLGLAGAITWINLTGSQRILPNPIAITNGPRGFYLQSANRSVTFVHGWMIYFFLQPIYIISISLVKHSMHQESGKADFKPISGCL